MKNRDDSATFAIGLFWLLVGLMVIAVGYKLDKRNEELQSVRTELNSVVENLYVESTKSEQLAAELDSMTKSLAEANETILALKSIEYELVYIGKFKVTYYCDDKYEHICGYGDHMTASGKPTEIGWTAAADWDVLPNGSVVYISGVGFREIADVGGAINGKHIDVLVEKHNEALDLGASNKDVWCLIKKGS